jgi:3-(3-hydroxy-phenyl)propionate hydroxylase
MTEDQRRILIAGGGPVGLLCAWLVGRHGLPVRLFDNNSAPQMDLRAATTHPATLDLLDDELVADMARVGLGAPIFQFWDRPSQELVAQFDHAVLENDTRHPFVVQCEQFKTAKLVLDRLQRHPNVEVLFDHEVTDVAQRADTGTVQVRGQTKSAWKRATRRARQFLLRTSMIASQRRAEGMALATGRVT